MVPFCGMEPYYSGLSLCLVTPNGYICSMIAQRPFPYFTKNQ